MGLRYLNPQRSQNISTIWTAIQSAPASPREKSFIHMMQRRGEIMLLDPVDDYFHYGTAGLGEALRPWRMPDWDATQKSA